MVNKNVFFYNEPDYACIVDYKLTALLAALEIF